MNELNRDFELDLRKSIEFQSLIDIKPIDYNQWNNNLQEKHQFDTKTKTIESKLALYQKLVNRDKKQYQRPKNLRKTNIPEQSSINQQKIKLKNQKLQNKILLPWEKKKYYIQQRLRASETIVKKIQPISISKSDSFKIFLKKEFSKKEAQIQEESSNKNSQFVNEKIKEQEQSQKKQIIKLSVVSPIKDAKKLTINLKYFNKDSSNNLNEDKNIQLTNINNLDLLRKKSQLLLSPKNYKFSQKQQNKCQEKDKLVISFIRQKKDLIQKNNLRAFSPEKSNFQSLVTRFPSKEKATNFFANCKTRTQKQFNKKSKIKSQIHFQRGKVLGRGRFGEVMLCQNFNTGLIIAVKKMSKKIIMEFHLEEQIKTQIKIHSRINHTNIVNFYGFFYDKNDIYIFLEYLQGGTLFQYQNNMNILPFKEAIQYIRQIIEAVNYLHNHSIVHRDIKPQNIVLSNGLVKLCDFGWTAVVDEPRNTFCGTPDYFCPQILEKKKYGTAVDIWCIGMLTYELLVGKMPFEGTRQDIFYKIAHIDQYSIQYPNSMPQEAKEFISSLLQKDPQKRPKCNQLKNFRLFTKYLNKCSKIQ